VKRGRLVLLVATVTLGLLFPSISQAAVSKPSAPTVVSITSSAKTGNVNITVRISLPKNNGGSKVTGSQVFAGGKSCTMKNLATSCTIKGIQAKKTVYVQASSKNVKGFGAKSKSITYLVGSSYPSKPVVVVPKPSATTPTTTPPTSTPVTTFNVTNIGATSYVINSQVNPTLTVTRGVTYTFAVNVSGHPFWLQTQSGRYIANNVYSSGVVGGGSQVGTITWRVPNDAPSTLFYVCQWHPSQSGQINVVNAR
jgi:hypothetical protein